MKEIGLSWKYPRVIVTCLAYILTSFTPAKITTFTVHGGEHLFYLGQPICLLPRINRLKSVRMSTEDVYFSGHLVLSHLGLAYVIMFRLVSKNGLFLVFESLIFLGLFFYFGMNLESKVRITDYFLFFFCIISQKWLNSYPHIFGR